MGEQREIHISEYFRIVITVQDQSGLTFLDHSAFVVGRMGQIIHLKKKAITSLEIKFVEPSHHKRSVPSLFLHVQYHCRAVNSQKVFVVFEIEPILAQCFKNLSGSREVSYHLE